MPRTPSLLRPLVAALLVVVSLAAGALPAQAGSRSGPALTVMTRNIYLGGDIARPIRAAAGLTGPAALVALGNANHELRSIVDATDFPTRSRLLASEISRTRPDVVGLQEVALWRSGPLELNQLGVVNATTVDYDFLAILLAELQRRGARYEVAAVQVETDLEAPAFLGNPLDGTATQARDVRLTIRDVILVRRHAGFAVTGSGGAQYTARIDIALGGIPFSIVRGYTYVDLRSRAGRVRVINTHLESQSSDLAFAQARELVTGPATATDLPTVVLGDFNSDPLDPTVDPGDQLGNDAAYRLLVGSGFADQWLAQRRTPGSGFTALLSELVNDPTAAGLNRRIDLVLARPAAGQAVRASRGVVVGDEIRDRDPRTGLWPADHAGVVLRLRFGAVST